jgi:small subunit ribosomal protein S6
MLVRTRHYEIAYLLNSELPPEEVQAFKQRMIDLAKSQGAEMGEVMHWERRRLAYAIKGKREAHYFFMPLTASAAAVAEIVRQLKLAEPVLRHLVIRLDTKPEPPKAPKPPKAESETAPAEA